MNYNVSESQDSQHIAINKMQAILSKGGPSYDDYDFVTDFCQENAPQMSAVKNTGLEFLYSNNSIMGHIRNKPYGYAGDFHIIDRIYTHDYSSQFEKWDRFSLQNSAAVAVRNRKTYFKNLVSSKVGKDSQQILNVASGPARDIFEFFEENENSNHINFTCVEMDQRAIDFALKLNQDHKNKITFINKNIFKFRTEEKFDMIWSAGLFDYFDDRAFVHTLSKMKDWIKPGGEIVIGNFNQECNPSRPYMEIIGEWFLNHRTDDELIALAVKAGFSKENLRIGREEENVNLFLHIKN